MSKRGKYDELIPTRIQLREKNDCAVVAVTVASGEDYESVHWLFNEMGRKSARGTEDAITTRVLKFLGLRLLPCDVKAKTVRTLERELKRGVYIVWTSGHVLCIRDGVVNDWTQGRLHRIRMVHTVRKENP